MHFQGLLHGFGTQAWVGAAGAVFNRINGRAGQEKDVLVESALLGILECKMMIALVEPAGSRDHGGPDAGKGWSRRVRWHSHSAPWG
jgi:hypothetical protein